MYPLFTIVTGVDTEIALPPAVAAIATETGPFIFKLPPVPPNPIT
jgi:hypothetical protein